MGMALKQGRDPVTVNPFYIPSEGHGSLPSPRPSCPNWWKFDKQVAGHTVRVIKAHAASDKISDCQLAKTATVRMHCNSRKMTHAVVTG